MIEACVSLRGVRPDLRLGPKLLSRIRPPTLLVWGDDDPFGSVDVGRRASELMPRARLEVVSGGHLPWLDQPGRCASLATEFLAAHA
jgi:2-hydroxy-6-oxonona-2,4-dienedioate hydrolase